MTSTTITNNGHQTNGHHHQFRSAGGGLLLITTAVSLLSISSTSLAWTSPLQFHGRTRNNIIKPVTNIATTKTSPITTTTTTTSHAPSITITSLQMVSNTVSIPRGDAQDNDSQNSNNNEDPNSNNNSLATEGNWSAYLDTNYNRIYYFNHDTGESLWEPPTDTFPEVNLPGQQMRDEQNQGPGGSQQQQQQQQNGGPMGNNIMNDEGPMNMNMNGNQNRPQDIMNNNNMNMNGNGPNNMMGNPPGIGGPEMMMNGPPGGGRMGGPAGMMPPEMMGPEFIDGPMFDGPMMGDPRMMMEGGPPMMDGGDPRMMNDPRMMMNVNGPMRGVVPPDGRLGSQPQFQPTPPQQQQQQQQGGRNGPPQRGPDEPTFYDILQVPPTATRAQIKQSYLNLAKLYDDNAPSGQVGGNSMDNGRNIGPQRGSGRRSKEFNEIARAWMVLSDGRSRERYDRQLDQWNAERRMRMKMMEEERQWMEEQQQQEQQGPPPPPQSWDNERGSVNPRGADNNFATGNKFEKDSVYKRKQKLGENLDGTNKFGQFRPQQSMGVDGRMSPPGGVGRGSQGSFVGNGNGRPLEIDEEAEMFAMEEAEYMEQQEEQIRERQRNEEQQQEDIRQQQEDMRRKQNEQFLQERQREERRRASSERDVIQDKPIGQAATRTQQQGATSNNMPWQKSPMQQPQEQGNGSGISGQDLNAMMANMKKNFAQQAQSDEAARVKDHLSSLGGGGSSSSAQPQSSEDQDTGRRCGVLFPGKGGVVAEPSDFVAKDILLDDYLKRGPRFVSWVPPENEGEESAQSPEQQQSSTTQQQGPPPPMGGRAGPAPKPMSGEKEREQERLRNMKASGMGGQQQQQQQSGRGSGVNIGSDNFGQTSSSVREQERLNNMRDVGGMGSGGMGSGGGVERTTLGSERLGGVGQQPKSSSTLREQQRLRDMNAMGSVADAAGQLRQPPQQSRQSNSIEELKEKHRQEMANLKREMEESQAQTLEEEIVKIAKIHAAEITKLQDQIEASQQQQAPMGGGPDVSQQRLAEMENAMQQMRMSHTAERESMQEEITQELEDEYEEKIRMMEEAHNAEIEKILAEAGSGDSEAMARLEAEIDKLKRAHFEEMESMAMNHDEAMTHLRNELEAKSAELIQGHQLEIKKLNQDQKAVSVADTLKFQEVAMEKLGAQHRQEVERLKAQHNQVMEKLRQDLESKSSISDVNVEAKVEEATNAMAAQFKADIDNMAAQHRQQMESTLQSELQNLQNEFAKEMGEALAEWQRMQQQAEHVTHNFKREGMTSGQRIEMVLKSFEGMYNPSVIEQVRQDINAQGEELEKQISDSNKQISMLQSKLDSSVGTEEKLHNEISSLTQWKEKAEVELQHAKQGSKEVTSLNNSIQSMNKEISDLKSQLSHLTQERDTSEREIVELREWKQNAKAELQNLERELKSKDGVIAKLKNELKERDEDVNLLIPEVARLQELTASLEALVKTRSREFDSLSQEADRLKSQYEKESKSAADQVQNLKNQITHEQVNNSQIIAKLKDDMKAKESELANLQSTASQRSRTINEITSKLETYQKESETTIDEGKKRIASLTANFEKQLAQNKEAHQSELQQLKQKLQSDIQRLQNDLNSRSDIITDLETKVSESSSSIKTLHGEMVGLNAARHTTETLLKDSSRDLDSAKQDVARMQKQIQDMKQFDATNTAKINSLERELSEKSAVLTRLQSEADLAVTEKGLLLEELNSLKQWRDTAQANINSLSSEVAFNSVSNEMAQRGKIEQVIQKLTNIQNELNQRDAQINHAKSSADAFIKARPQPTAQQAAVKEAVRPKLTKPPPLTRPVSPPAGGASRSSFARKMTMPNVVGGGFMDRKKNVATVGGQSRAEPTPVAERQTEHKKSYKFAGATARKTSKPMGGYLDNLSP